MPLFTVRPIPKTQTFGDVLHALAQTDPKKVKALEVIARWQLAEATAPQPELRAKHLRPAKAVLPLRPKKADRV